jgi:uroporphyrinogen decarboxylase
VKNHFGLAADDHEGLKKILGVDFRSAHAAYKGKPLHVQVPNRRVDPLWGWHTREVEHDGGNYWDYCDFPLREADLDQVEAWPMPSPDDYDYQTVRERCTHFKEYAVNIGGAGLACIMNTAGFLRGMDQMFVDLATDDPAGMRLIDRFIDIQFEIAQRELEAAKGGFDFMWLGEDLGTQAGPIISMEMFQKIIKPRHQRFIDLAKSYKLPVMIHTCGSSSWAYEEYIAMGMNAVDTLQPEAFGMDPATLKRRFGGRLAFHGCISTTGPLSFGTTEDVRKQVRDTLAILTPGTGYMLSPTHSIQNNSPLENVLAMYDEAHKAGKYR